MRREDAGILRKKGSRVQRRQSAYPQYHELDRITEVRIAGGPDLVSLQEKELGHGCALQIALPAANHHVPITHSGNQSPSG